MQHWAAVYNGGGRRVGYGDGCDFVTRCEVDRLDGIIEAGHNVELTAGFIEDDSRWPATAEADVVCAANPGVETAVLKRSRIEDTGAAGSISGKIQSLAVGTYGHIKRSRQAGVFAAWIKARGVGKYDVSRFVTNQQGAYDAGSAAEEVENFKSRVWDIDGETRHRIHRYHHWPDGTAFKGNKVWSGRGG